MLAHEASLLLVALAFLVLLVHSTAIKPFAHVSPRVDDGSASLSQVPANYTFSSVATAANLSTPNALEPWPSLPFFLNIPDTGGGWLAVTTITNYGSERSRRYTAVATEQLIDWISVVTDLQRQSFQTFSDELVTVEVAEISGALPITKEIRAAEVVGLGLLYTEILKKVPVKVLQGVFQFGGNTPAILTILVSDSPPETEKSLADRPPNSRFDADGVQYRLGWKEKAATDPTRREGDGWDTKHAAGMLERAILDLQKAKDLGEPWSQDLKYYSPGWDLEWTYTLYEMRRGTIDVQIAAVTHMLVVVKMYGVDNADYIIDGVGEMRRYVRLGYGKFGFKIPVVPPQENGLNLPSDGADRTTF